MMKQIRMKKRIAAAMLLIFATFSLIGCGAAQFNDAKSDMSAAQDTTAADGPSVDYNVTEDAVIGEEWPEDYNVAEDAVDDSADMDMDDAALDSGMAGGAAQAETVQTNEKIIYTYNYTVETRAFDDLMDALQQRVDESGGYVESAEVRGNSDMNIKRYANMVIRIPVEKMHSFLDMVAKLTNVTYSNRSTENVTLSYVDMKSHIEALRTEQKTLMSILERAEKLEDIITIQSQLTNIRYELESYESQLRVYDNRINYSTLYLDITEVERETNVATELTYGEEISKGLSDTFYNIGQGLRGFSIWFIVNLPVIVIWIAIIAVIALIVRWAVKTYLKKKARRQAGRLESQKKNGQADSGIWTSQTEKDEEKTNSNS